MAAGRKPFTKPEICFFPIGSASGQRHRNPRDKNYCRTGAGAGACLSGTQGTFHWGCNSGTNALADCTGGSDPGIVRRCQPGSGFSS